MRVLNFVHFVVTNRELLWDEIVFHMYENVIKSPKNSFRTCTEQTFHNNVI